MNCFLLHGGRPHSDLARTFISESNGCFRKLRIFLLCPLACSACFKTCLDPSIVKDWFEIWVGDGDFINHSSMFCVVSGPIVQAFFHLIIVSGNFGIFFRQVLV